MERMDSRARVLGLVALLVGLLDCASGEGAKTCTVIGCSDGFSLELSPNASWPVGEYRFELTVGAGKQICTGKVPFPPCGTPALSCVGGPVGAISESGCALPAPQH